jgi:hypothetical protein
MIELTNPATAIVAGEWHTCAITNSEDHHSDDGQIFCWSGAGGSGLHISMWHVDLGHGAVAISGSSDMNKYCAISANGSIGCWTLDAINYNPNSENSTIVPANLTSDLGGQHGGLGSGLWPSHSSGGGSYRLIDFRAFSISQGDGTHCALGQSLQEINSEFYSSTPFVCWGIINSGTGSWSSGMQQPRVWDYYGGNSLGGDGPFMTLVGNEWGDDRNSCLLIKGWYWPMNDCEINGVSHQYGPQSQGELTVLGGDYGEMGDCFILSDYTLSCAGNPDFNYFIPTDFSVGNRDFDNDSVWNVLDAFPLDDSEWDDTDFDGIGNNQDSDDDGDGFEDSSDVFPLNSSEWADLDGDGIGDNSDPDDDNDGHSDITDSFPFDSSEWTDFDEDGIGDNGDPDDDNDGFSDSEDAFPFNPAEWLDTDGDGIGNNADSDDDGDHWDDSEDAFPLDQYAQVDTDSDGLPDHLWGPSLLVEDDDDDNDGFTDNEESECNSLQQDPTSTPEDFDFDGDGICDRKDDDDDNDGYPDSNDSFRLNASEWVDTDYDNIGDNSDIDDDNDGVLDSDDFCPSGVTGPVWGSFVSGPETDRDSDGCMDSDLEDLDDDNDGIPDSGDLCPLGSMNWTSNQSSDFDGDGCRDADEDNDDDNDGFSDWQDTCPFDDSQWEGDCPNSENTSEDVYSGLLLVGGGALGGTLAVAIYVYISRKNIP